MLLDYFSFYIAEIMNKQLKRWLFVCEMKEGTFAIKSLVF